MRLVIALYKLDTQGMQNLSVMSRIEGVSAAVKLTKQFTEGQGTAFWQDKKALRAIFLAPEYAFARSLAKGQGDHSFGTKRQMEEDYVKEKLRPEFGSLSQKFENALIVPGTVAWRKSLLPATGSKNRTRSQVESDRRQKYEGRLQDGINVNLQMSQADTFTESSTVFPNTFKRGDDPRSSVDTMQDKLDRLETARYIAKNTAHCYYNGDCVYKYNKIGDFYEVPEQNPDTVMVPNRGSTVSGTSVGPGRFSVAGLDFGISICYDQSLSVQSTGPVKTFEPLQRTDGPVDIHLLLSAHIPPDLWAANLNDPGLLLSCSSKDHCNKVLWNTGQQLRPSKRVKFNANAVLDLYVLDN